LRILHYITFELFRVA